MRLFLLAFQFLTIIPLKVSGDVSAREMAKSSYFFPLVGAVQGLLLLFSAAILSKIFPLEITSGLIVLVLIVSNGGFEIDGLADTFDAMSVKSSGNALIDREKRLTIMKDSTTGVIGVTAIVMTILLKYLFIKSMFQGFSLFTVCCLLFLMPVFSKWVTIPAMYHGVSARRDGLGSIFIDNIGIGNVAVSSILVLLMYLIVARLQLFKTYSIASLLLFVILFILLYMLSLVSARFFKSRFGGLTGDNLGAITEISEIFYLMVTSAWLQHYIW